MTTNFRVFILQHLSTIIVNYLMQ